FAVRPLPGPQFHDRKPLVEKLPEGYIALPQRLAELPPSEQFAQLLLGVLLLPVKHLAVIMALAFTVARQEDADQPLIFAARDHLTSAPAQRFVVFVGLVDFVGFVGHSSAGNSYSSESSGLPSQKPSPMQSSQ